MNIFERFEQYAKEADPNIPHLPLLDLNRSTSTMKITSKYIADLFDSGIFTTRKMGIKTLVGTLTLPNGFEICESSACVNPEDYNEAIGTALIRKRIEDRLWNLEGYMRQEEYPVEGALALAVGAADCPEIDSVDGHSTETGKPV